jgi:hypothetical protein
MSEIKHPKIMVTAVMADRKPVDLHMFKNYKSACDILGLTTPSTNRRIPPPAPGRSNCKSPFDCVNSFSFFFRQKIN